MTAETEPHHHPDHGHVRPDREITVKIVSADEDRDFTFPLTTKVGEVIGAAVKAFGLDPSDAYDLILPKRHGGGGHGGGNHNTPLDKGRPLGSYPEIKDGTKLILTSRGGGV